MRSGIPLAAAMMMQSGPYEPPPITWKHSTSHSNANREAIRETMRELEAKEQKDSRTQIRPAAHTTTMGPVRRPALDQDKEEDAVADEMFAMTPQGRAQLSKPLEARESQPIPKPRPKPQGQDGAADPDELLAQEMFQLASDGRPSRPLSLSDQAMAGDLGPDDRTDDEIADDMFALSQSDKAQAGKSEAGNLEVDIEDKDSMVGLSDQGLAMGADDDSGDSILADELFRLASQHN